MTAIAGSRPVGTPGSDALPPAGARWVRAVLFALALCWIAPAAAPAGQPLDAYRLGPGDRVKLTVFGHPRESGEFDVDGLGNLAYPPFGRVAARGHTVAELQEFVRAGLDRRLIVNPRVTVEVMNYRPFYIYGEVKRSGGYPYVAGLTVRRAVAIAGGFTRRARHAPVDLIREGRTGADTVESALDVPVLPGDIIEVSRRLFQPARDRRARGRLRGDAATSSSR